MNIFILGGDGFCGWPTALRLSNKGHKVTIIDNLSRRNIDLKMGTESLTPIASIHDRLSEWKRITGKSIEFVDLNLATEFDRLTALLSESRPEAIIHFAEQRSAPYSMLSAHEKNYTVYNNINATHNLLSAIVKTKISPHVIHLGTMGVYGYDKNFGTIPEGYLPVVTPNEPNAEPANILYPTNPGSVYHLTKSMDQLMFAFYAKNNAVAITDLHQGIVWGTQTAETKMSPVLTNRFDYDGEYGTVLNRFLIQAASGAPLTVYGTGGQTRAFININDTIKCIEIALDNPPLNPYKVEILNQVAEVQTLKSLAAMVANLFNADIKYVENPRNELAENELAVSNETFISRGLDPIKITESILSEVVDNIDKYKERFNAAKIMSKANWTRNS